MGANSGKPFTCAICSETVTEDGARPDSCPQHIFHRKCLLKLASHSNQCPIDQKEFFEVVYEGGTRAIIQHQNSEDFRENPVVQELAAQIVLTSLRMVENFSCEICSDDDIDPENGVASPMDCEHRFHKACLLNALKSDNHCPSCMRKVQKIICSTGETIDIEENRLRHLMAALSAGEDFKCNICDSADTFQERALVGDCKHEFHRECIVEYARHDSTCPTCSQKIMKISCLYGAVLTITPPKAASAEDEDGNDNDGEKSDAEEKSNGKEEAEGEEKLEEEVEKTSGSEEVEKKDDERTNEEGSAVEKEISKEAPSEKDE